MDNYFITVSHKRYGVTDNLTDCTTASSNYHERKHSYVESIFIPGNHPDAAIYNVTNIVLGKMALSHNDTILNESLISQLTSLSPGKSYRVIEDV